MKAAAVAPAPPIDAGAARVRAVPAHASRLAWPRPAYAWYVVLILCLAYTVSWIDRQLLSLLVPAIKQTFAVSDTQIGLLQGLAFAIFYTAAGLPFGRLADSRHRVSIIALSSALWCVATALCGVARSWGQLFLARIGVGIGEGALNPAAISLITDYFPNERRGLPLGVYAGSGGVGAGLALLIGGSIIAAVQAWGPQTVPYIGTLQPWQIVFVLVGLPGLAVSLLMITVREPVRRGLLDQTQVSWAAFGHFLRSRDRLFYHHIGGFTLLNVFFYGMNAWAPTFFMRTYGWTPGQVGQAFGAVFLVACVLGGLAGGLCVDGLRARGYADAAMRTMAIGLTAVVLPALLAPLAASGGLSLLLWGMAIFCITFVGASASASLQAVTPNEFRGRMTALFFVIANVLGMGLGPLIVALCTDYAFGDEASLRYSLVAVATIVTPIAAVVVWRGLALFRSAQLEA